MQKRYKVAFDDEKISLTDIFILQYYFRIIDPALPNRQNNDVGKQYRTGIYYTDTADEHRR
ncbi:peptide-methionine (S)-S-oxide reductase [Neisseria iguanae]|uniref:peptide-methionine (S)-S-oxide reductase n=1 Tax=Neisseria iguanae TaxID=90242 RepID=A0A2P7TXX3_9NEIS|nr:peptide-methionine (S)-S-oxide reductase [Neisseria iguanae]PSJ79551.1 hypothetical protein C7N83_11540 [Neisseria iguanae]